MPTPSPDPAAPPHRLRDLDRAQAVAAALVVLAFVGQFAISVHRARQVGWLPAGDDALIGLRALDVGGAHSPLVGQPSSSHLYDASIGTSHPGPIEFWWLALPVRLLGASWGMLLGAAAFNLAAVLVAAWIVLRRAGPAVAGWSCVLLGLVLVAQGSAILSDPISSSAGAIPLLALAAAAWAIADGDVRLLPLGAALAAWVGQQHLSIVIPAGALAVLAVVGICLQYLTRDRDAEGDRWWPWVLGGVVMTLALWSPVLVQQVQGDPGNLTAVVRYASEGEGASLGGVSGLRQVARSLGVPPPLLRSDVRGDQLFGGPLRIVEAVGAVAMLAALVAVIVVAWRRRRSLSLLAVTALVLAGAGGWNGTAIPDSVEAFRTSFYRWTFVVSWLGWTALGWAGGLAWQRVARRRGRTVPAWAAVAGPAVVAVAVLVPTVVQAATRGTDDDRRDQDGFAALALLGDVADAAADEAGPDAPVTLLLNGRSALLSSGAALGLSLEADGHRVEVVDQDERFWGEQRVVDGEDPNEVVLLLVTGRDEVFPFPGRRLAWVDLDDGTEPARTINDDDVLELRALTREELEQVLDGSG